MTTLTTVPTSILYEIAAVTPARIGNTYSPDGLVLEHPQADARLLLRNLNTETNRLEVHTPDGGKIGDYNPIELKHLVEFWCALGQWLTPSKRPQALRMMQDDTQHAFLVNLIIFVNSCGTRRVGEDFHGLMYADGELCARIEAPTGASIEPLSAWVQEPWLGAISREYVKRVLHPSGRGLQHD